MWRLLLKNRQKKLYSDMSSAWLYISVYSFQRRVKVWKLFFVGGPPLQNPPFSEERRERPSSLPPSLDPLNSPLSLPCFVLAPPLCIQPRRRRRRPPFPRRRTIDYNVFYILFKKFLHHHPPDQFCLMHLRLNVIRKSMASE